MISDTLHDAAAEIREYLKIRPDAYKDIEPQILDLVIRMETMVTLLDAPPGPAN